MNLVIVESPTKARTLGRFLGNDYEIQASMGHLVDLPKSKLGVDVEHGFTPQYELVGDKKDIVEDLKKSAKKADLIILATDPDREGEAIAAHIAQLLTTNLQQLTSSQLIKRIIFHEITKEAIEEALKNPRDIDIHLVDAQTARRILDRLVGYKLSPLLWRKVRRGLSAGRVQSVALRLVVERERELKKFKKEPFFRIKAILSATEFELIEVNGEKVEVQETLDLYDGDYRVTKTNIENEKQAQKVIEELKDKRFTVADILQKEVRRAPPPPFTTSTLQQEAARRLGFAGKRTMRVAQKLYEEGFITYHRTDSVNIAKVAMFAIRNFIEKQFGNKFLPEKPRFYKTKQKLAQEAHEAIRPTNVNNEQTTINKQLGGDYGKLYELIWRRAVASQMAEAVLELTTVHVDTIHPRGAPQAQPHLGGGRMDSPEVNYYRFKASGSVLVFEGFLKVAPLALEDKKLPKFKVLEPLNLLNLNAELHETQPPPRYNYASLVGTLEEKGIGRPSTYAPIISTLEDRQYIELQEKRFVPTPVGTAVNDFLVANFSDIDDIPFTAQMEDSLDSIAHGEKDWVPMMREFYGPFEKKLEAVQSVARVKIEVEETSEDCEKWVAPMVLRIGRFGKFLSCSKFPECDFTKAFVEETNFLCPKDGGKIVVKKTRRGRRFYGCSNYPTCDYASWRLKEL